MLTENERVRRYGFTQTELDRAKANLLTAVETSYNKREKRSHDQFCSSYRDHYLTNEPAPGIEFIFRFLEEILPGIGLEEINALPAAWMTDSNRIAVVSGPDEEGQHHLSEAEVVDIMEKVEAAEIEPYVDEVSDLALMDTIPAGGTVVATRQVPELDAVEWTLGNGARVVYRYSDLTKDEIRFLAYSPGGTSIYPVELLPSARMTSGLVQSFGVGKFDATALEKVMSGKNATVAPSIGGLTEGLDGSCSPDDFETMLQLIYLYFENPRFDRAAYEASMQRNRAWIEKARNDPQKAMRDSISLITNDHNPRAMVFDLDYLERVDFDTVEMVYRDRMKDASDFIFFFVGYMQADQARPLIETYIGAIGDKDRDETWVDNGVGMPEGRTERTIPIELSVPKATVYIKYGNQAEYTPENWLHLRVIEEVLDLRYTEVVREDEGGTYGVTVQRSMVHYPREKMGLTIRFDCDPDEAPHLKSLIYKEIDALMDAGPSRADLDKTIENMLKQREEIMRRNGFWMSVLRSYYYHGINIAAPENYDQILEAMTVESVREAARRMLEGADIVDLTFLPATGQ
jgi:zinc protease